MLPAPDHPVGNGRGIPDWDEEAMDSVLQNIRRTSGSRRQDGHTRGHGFQNHMCETLNQRGQDEQIASAQKMSEFAWRKTFIGANTSDAKFVDERPVYRMVAANQHLEVLLWQRPHGFKKIRQSFSLGHAPDPNDTKRILRPGCKITARIVPGLHSVGNHMYFASR